MVPVEHPKLPKCPKTFSAWKVSKFVRHSRAYDPERKSLPGETAVITCKIEGNPTPTYKWLRGNREVLHGGRFKHLTDGENNTVTLLMNKARSQDDGPYQLLIENEHGQDKAIIKLFVTDPSGLDFRSMLKHREYEQWGLDKSQLEEVDLKKQEQQRRPSLKPDKKAEGWERELTDVRVQQTVDKQARFSCMFSNPRAKIKWLKGRQELFTVSLPYCFPFLHSRMCGLLGHEVQNRQRSGNLYFADQ